MQQRTAVIVGAVVLGLAATGLAARWQPERQVHEETGAVHASDNAPPLAMSVMTPNEAVTRKAAIDTTTLEGVSGEDKTVDEPGAPPSVNQDAALQAAFEELLEDSDPEVRREAERLAQEFEVLDGE